MKGVSPVVATVLLIAIAVIAAIGVWYWVGAYTGKPSVSVDQKAFTIESCNRTHAVVRNIGSVMITQDADIYYSGAKVGVLDINGAGGVLAGKIKYVSILNETNGSSTTLASGVYNIIDGNYPQQTFACK
jgi:flagellin-like protein